MILVDNPWPNLCPSEGSYVLDEDREFIQQHNDSVGAEAKIAVRSIPEPFIGDPKSAKVVLLGLNPGHSEDDEENYRND